MKARLLMIAALGLLLAACRRKLQRLCKDLRHLLPEHINNDTGDCREIVANRIQALIDFV
jgi:hypothetical protein